MEAFLTDTADSQPPIIVPGPDEARVGKREDLFMDRPVEPSGVAVLKIHAPASSNQQAIAGERRGTVMEYIGKTAGRVARRCTHLDTAVAEHDRVAMNKKTIRTFGVSRPCQHDAASQGMFQEPGPGDMIGMDMSLERRHESEFELLQECPVAARLVKDRIDQNRFPCLRTANEIVYVEDWESKSWRRRTTAKPRSLAGEACLPLAILSVRFRSAGHHVHVEDTTSGKGFAAQRACLDTLDEFLVTQGFFKRSCIGGRDEGDFAFDSHSGNAGYRHES